MRVKVFKKQGRKIIYFYDCDLLDLIFKEFFEKGIVLKGKFYLQVDEKVEVHYGKKDEVNIW